MNFTSAFSDILQLLAGIGIFLVACEMMSDNLEAISSEKLKKLFSNVSDNRLIGVMIGAIATLAIQSSAATTVMTIGFVNAGIISLAQAATIIFGGEIGTTITGQIVALGMFGSNEIDLNVIFSALAGIGVFVNMFAKNEKSKRLGNVLAGLGMLFAGLNMMSNAMKSFAELESLKIFLSSINNRIILIIIGAIITAIIQSSSAITSIAITMVVSNLISLEQGIYITLGANVGTCLTGILAGMKTTGTNARRASLIQLIFNVGGVVLFVIADYLIKILSNSTVSSATFFEQTFPGVPHVQLAMFHTFFNILSVLLVLPISDKLVNLTKRFVVDNPEQVETERFYYVDENMLSTPPIAIEQIKKEIVNMAKFAIDNFNRSIYIVKTLDFKDQELFNNVEKQLNFLNRNLVELITKLRNRGKINRKDSHYLATTYRAISDFERIGDYSENIVEYAQNLKDNDECFSEEALKEIDELSILINKLYEETIRIYTHYSSHKDLSKAKEIEDKIDKLSKKMADNHIKRLNEGKCSASVGAQYLKLSSDVERIGDHLININDKDYEISH